MSCYCGEAGGPRVSWKLLTSAGRWTPCPAPPEPPDPRAPLSPHAPTTPGCTSQEKCEQWAKAGECEKNKEYMEDTCKRACHKCSATKPPDESLKPKGADLAKNLEEMAKKLQQGDGGQHVREVGQELGAGEGEGGGEGIGEGGDEGGAESCAAYSVSCIVHCAPTSRCSVEMLPLRNALFRCCLLEVLPLDAIPQDSAPVRCCPLLPPCPSCASPQAAASPVPSPEASPVPTPMASPVPSPIPSPVPSPVAAASPQQAALVIDKASTQVGAAQGVVGVGFASGLSESCCRCCWWLTMLRRRWVQHEGCWKWV